MADFGVGEFTMDEVSEPEEVSMDGVLGGHKRARASSSGESAENVNHKKKKTVVCFADDIKFKKGHMNVIFIGHEGAGKSTIIGQIGDFETESTRFTILDSKGHQTYVPEMIARTSQADLGVLVISARECKAKIGYENGRQTCEHVQVANALGVSKLLILVNQMDAVNWAQQRFDEIVSKTIPDLESSGYIINEDIQFLPVSGLIGFNIKTKVDKNICSWFDGPCLFEALSAVESPPRYPESLLRIPVVDTYEDMGTFLMGKIEYGTICEGDMVSVIVDGVVFRHYVRTVTEIYCDNDRVRCAKAGENVQVLLSNTNAEEVYVGSVLCCYAKPIRRVNCFIAEVHILQLAVGTLFTAEYRADLYSHSVVVECRIHELLHQRDAITKRPPRKPLTFARSNTVVNCCIEVARLIDIEKFSQFPQLARFILRQGNQTVATGKVLDFIGEHSGWFY